MRQHKPRNLAGATISANPKHLRTCVTAPLPVRGACTSAGDDDGNVCRSACLCGYVLSASAILVSDNRKDTRACLLV